MNPDKWQQVKEIFNAAVVLAPGERSAFLSQVSGDDDDVRREVEILLHSYESGYLEEPIIKKIAGNVTGEEFAAGQSLGHYIIREKLGAGGMGEVYLADDTKLHRQVAIKFLKTKSSFDTKAEKRLLREARAAAMLDHPNICTIHEVGTSEGRSFIVMPYIEGETLDTRIKRESLPLLEGIDIALSIADALTEAHSHKIVHRDIKPSNVIISSRGQIKVLDFSLAKKVLVEGDDATESLSGTIAGTIAYMSPEQARGHEIDSRSDIWSLGVVLYEMLTGCLPFSGETKSDLIASILRNEPTPLTNYLQNPPTKIKLIINKALRKNRDERYLTAQDLSADLKRLREMLNSQGFSKEDTNTLPVTPSKQTAQLQEISTEEKARAYILTVSAETPATDESEVRSSIKQVAAKINNRKIIVLAILLTILLSGAAIWKIAQLRQSKPLPFSADSRATLQISPLFNTKRKPNGSINSLSFSPDGNLVAFVLSEEGRSNIFIEQTSGGEPFKITDGKWTVLTPVWSPGGQRIAFASNRDNKTGIWTVSYLGGTPVLLRAMELPLGLFNLKKWSRDERKIYYESKYNLYTLDLESGQTELVTALDNSSSSIIISPDEEMIAYVKHEKERTQIWIQPLHGSQATPLVTETNHNWSPAWFPDNQSLAYSSNQNGNFQIYVVNIKDSITTQITFGETNAADPVVSLDGLKIAYISNIDEANIYSYNLYSGKETAQTANVNLQLFPDISPDSKRIVFQVTDDAAKIFESPLKIKPIDADSESWSINNKGSVAKWSPDGQTLAFLRSTGMVYNLWKVNVDDGKEKQLTTDGIYGRGFTMAPFNLLTDVFNWSPDGRQIAYSSKKSGHLNLWTISQDDSKERMWTQNADSNLKITSPFWSPDGKRIAYVAETIPQSSADKPQHRVCIAEAGQTENIFQTPSQIRLLGWTSSSAEIFIAMKDKTDVVLIKLSTSHSEQAKQIARLPDAHLHGIKFSSDGKQVAFSARRNGNDNIYLVSINGGEPYQITANSDAALYYSGITWSPDGKQLFYSKQTGGMQISIISNPK